MFTLLLQRLLNPNSHKHPLVVKNYHSYVVVSRKKYFAEELSELSRLSQVEEETAQSIIMDRPGASGIAGVVNELLIPFGVM